MFQDNQLLVRFEPLEKLPFIAGRSFVVIEHKGWEKQLEKYFDFALSVR